MDFSKEKIRLSQITSLNSPRYILSTLRISSRTEQHVVDEAVTISHGELLV